MANDSFLSKFYRDKTKRTTFIVFAIDVVILIIVMIILWVMPQPKTPGEACGYMCLPDYKNPEVKHCGCRAKLFEEYLKQSFESSYDRVDKEYTKQYHERISKIYGGYIGDVKPVAHLIGEKREPSEKTNQPVKEWYKGNNCLLLNGVSEHNGRLRVPVSGYYHVYSMLDISFHYTEAGRVPDNRPALEQTIYTSNIKDETKQTVVASTCHPYEYSRNDVFGRFDSFIGSDVYLNAGDEVYIKVSNISQVNSPPKNIFGLYML